MAISEFVYWDACVFIEWIQQTDSTRVALLRPIVDAAHRRELTIVTSAFTLAEVIKCKSEPDQPPKPISDEDEQAIIAFFKNPYIAMRNLDRKIGSLARSLSREALKSGRSLKPPDAVHIATAIERHLTVFQTFDGKLQKYDKMFGTPVLQIEPPSYILPTPPPSEPSPQRRLFVDVDGESMGTQVHQEVERERQQRISQRADTGNAVPEIQGTGEPPSDDAAAGSERGPAAPEAEAAGGELKA